MRHGIAMIVPSARRVWRRSSGSLCQGGDSLDATMAFSCRLATPGVGRVRSNPGILTRRVCDKWRVRCTIQDRIWRSVRTRMDADGRLTCSSVAMSAPDVATGCDTIRGREDDVTLVMCHSFHRERHQSSIHATVASTPHVRDRNAVVALLALVHRPLASGRAGSEKSISTTPALPRVGFACEIS
jgi:hypothetical protein